MSVHIIESGVVVGSIVASLEEAQAAFPNSVCVESPVGGIGWVWDGVGLSAPQPSLVSPQQEVPDIITPRQGRIILARLGLLESIDAYFSGLAGEGAVEARIEWEYASEWERSCQTLIDAAHSLGITDEQIDEMFRNAALL